MNYSGKKSEERKIASGRIKVLFREAKDIFRKDRALANRYVHLARELSMKLKVKIPPELKKQFCKYCHHYLMPSVNCRVRLQRGKIVYYCLDCRHFMRFPYLKEQKAKRAAKKKRV